MVGIVWEGGDGSRGDRIAHVGGLINVFAFFLAGILLWFQSCPPRLNIMLIGPLGRVVFKLLHCGAFYKKVFKL